MTQNEAWMIAGMMAVAFGMDPVKDAALQRNTIRSGKLEGMAKKG